MSEIVGSSARKGQIVALDRQHEYVSADMKRHFYTRFYIGVVEVSSRAGKVKFVRLAGANHATMVNLGDRVLTLNSTPEIQVAAKTLFASITKHHCGFDSAEELRIAIRAHMASS